MQKLMKISILGAVVALLAAAPTFTVAGLFDRPLTVTRSLNDKPWGYQIVQAPEPVRFGKSSQKFEVRAGDCSADAGWSDCANDRERSEVSVEKKLYPDSNYWLSWSVYLPVDFQESPKVKASLGQIHQKGGPSGMAGGFPSKPPLFQLDAVRGKYLLTFHRLSGEFTNVRDEGVEYPLASLEDMRGKWTDVVVHFNARTDGVLEFIVNGLSVVTIEKPVTFKPREFYMKYGIYRSFVSRHGGPMPTQVVYYDEVRVGTSREDVDSAFNKKLDPVD